MHIKRKKRSFIFISSFLLLCIGSTVSLMAQCEDLIVTVTSDPSPPFNLCPGETILLTSTVTGGTPPYTYSWLDGTTNPTSIIVPPYYGQVYVQVTDAVGCVAWGEIHIKAWVWTVDIIFAPFTVCEGDSMALHAFPDFPVGTTFLWSTGETTSPIYITESGTYSITATAPGGECTTSTTEFVEMYFFPTPDPDISGPAVLCSGQNGTLTAQQNPDDSFLWNTGDVTASIVISDPGIYSVTITNWQGCTGADTVEVLPGTAPPTLSGPTVLCNGQSGTVSVTNQNSYTSFLWNTGATTSSITINNAGTYTVTVTAPGGCTSTGSITVASGNSNMNIDGTTIPSTSCTNPNGSINVTVTPAGSYTYSWSNGATTEDINNLPAGNYLVTVTDAGGCTSSASFAVTSNLVIPTTNTNITSTTCDLNNGAVDLSVMPAGDYTFLWSNGSVTEDLSNIIAGNYDVTVTSSSGCTATASVTVPNNNPVINVTGIITPFTSCALPNGAIDITVAPSGTYTYTWSNGSTTEDLADLIAGNYTVTVSAGGSCTVTSNFTVLNNTIPPLPGAAASPDTCGQSTGSIDLTVTPVEPYTFLWSNGSTTEDLNNISGGIYSVTITSVLSGCSATLIDTVTSYTPPIVVNSIITASTCGQNNGAVDLNIMPAGTYSFYWSNGNTSEDIDLIFAGNYSVTVTSSVGCSNTATFIVPDNPIQINISGTTSPNTSCTNENGSVDITINPAGTYSFAWSNGTVTEDLNNVPAGVYTVTVTLGLTCISTQSFEVINEIVPFTITGITTPNTSCTQPNGEIDITVIGAGSYTYFWSNGETTEDILQLTGGTYSVTVTGADGCTTTDEFDIINTNSNFSLAGIVTPHTTCLSPNGQIDLTLSPPGVYSFVWTTGVTTEDLTDLAAGTYGVTVTDINNCALVDLFVVQDDIIYPIITSQINPSTCGNSNGSIELNVTPLIGNTYIWSHGETNEDVLDLIAGNYAVTVTGANGCKSNETFIVPDSSSAPVLSANIIPATCGATNGAIDLIINPPINNSILWSSGSTLEDLTDVAPGTYSVMVTDMKGCIAMDTFIVQNINNNFTLSGVPLPNTSCTISNGSIDLTIVPAGNYTFLWSNGAVTEDISGLPEGEYAVTVTDVNSCKSISTFEVINNTNQVLISALITPANCGLNNGSIDITASPATENVFLWSNGATSEDLQNLVPGNYSLVITGSNGCTTTDTFSIIEVGSSISVTGLTSANTSCSIPNGAIDLTVSPNGVYSFAWSNGSITEDLISTGSGTYSVIVTDYNGCSSSASFVITDQTILPVITGNVTPSVCGESNGQVALTVLPAGNYSYIWSNGVVVEDLQNVMAGIYPVTVTSMNGCTSSSDFTVPNINSNFSISGIASGNTSCVSNNGTIDITMTPAGNYNFTWSNGANTEDLQNLPPGIYIVTVTDLSNCSSSSAYIVEDIIVDLIVFPVITPVLCGEANGRIDLTVTPSTGNQFIWSNGQTGKDLEDVLPGNYSVTITAQNGCTWSSTFTLPSSEKVTVDLQADLASEQGDSITITTEVNIDIGTVDTVMWYPENLFSCEQDFCMQQTILTPHQLTEIMIMVVDTNGCIGEARLMLDIVTDPEVYIPNVFTPDHDGINDRFTVYGNEDVELILELQIFDRWGNQVFVNHDFPPNEENYGWDGVFKNQEMNPAVFAYWAQVRFANGNVGRYRGDVTLVR